jgi:hypothetical protein
MDYADIYYVDTRNADSRDHRTQSSGPVIHGRVMSPVPVHAGGTGVRTVYVPHPAAPYGGTVPMIGGVPMIPGQYPAIPGYPGYPGYPAIYGQPSAAATLLGKLTTGDVVSMVAQIFAALQPLPAAPVATSDASTDVGNLIMYQGALAQHAKRDEQVRTLGGLVAKLVG